MLEKTCEIKVFARRWKAGLYENAKLKINSNFNIKNIDMIRNNLIKRRQEIEEKYQ